jgi:hypothetical protein
MGQTVVFDIAAGMRMGEKNPAFSGARQDSGPNHDF